MKKYPLKMDHLIKLVSKRSKKRKMNMIIIEKKEEVQMVLVVRNLDKNFHKKKINVFYS